MTPTGVFFENMKTQYAKVYVTPSMGYPLPIYRSKPYLESWEEAMRVSATTISVLLILGMDIEQELIEDAAVPRGTAKVPVFYFGGQEDKNPDSMEAIDIFKQVHVLNRDYVLRSLPTKYNVHSACYKPQERRHDLKDRFIKR